MNPVLKTIGIIFLTTSICSFIVYIIHLVNLKRKMKNENKDKF